MSISTQITRISTNVSNALTAIASKGVTVPASAKSDNLASLIALIPTYQDIFPVGSLWATEDSTKTPASVLGFGTWVQVSPSNITWGNLYDSTWQIVDGTSGGLFVYKRTA